MAALAPKLQRSGARSGAVSRAARSLDEGRKPQVRPKLKVSGTNDPLEHEADRVADSVMRSASSPPSFPMGDTRKDQKAQRKTVPGEAKLLGPEPKSESKDRGSAKKPEIKRAAKPGDEKVKRAAKPGDEKVHRAAGGKDDRVKRATKPGDKKTAPANHAQRASKPDDKAQRSATNASQDKPVQRDAAAGGGANAGGGSTTAPAGFESSLGRVQQGSGEPLSAPTQQFMESGFGRSFSNVRVYADGGAASLANSIDARAFTLGNNLYFGPGQYQPHTHDGKRLIAHELTHVVQQTGSGEAQRSIQRAKKGSAPGGTSTTTPAGGGASTASGDKPEVVNEFSGKDPKTKIVATGPGVAGGKFFLRSLKLPMVGGDFKGHRNHKVADLQGRAGDKKNELISGNAFELLGPSERSSVTARQRWLAKVRTDGPMQSGLQKAIESKFRLVPAADAPSGQASAGGTGDAPASLGQGKNPSYYLRRNVSDKSTIFIVGDLKQVAEHDLVMMPAWNKDKKPQDYHVDHMHELQLGGLDGWENFCLLDVSSNTSSGGKISNAMERDVKNLIEQASVGTFWKDHGGQPDPSEVIKGANWKIEFAEFEQTSIKGPGDYWTKSEIKDGKQLEGLRDMKEKEIVSEGLRFKPGDMPNTISVFTDPHGGFYQKIVRHGKNWAPKKEGVFYRGFDNVRAHIDAFDSVKDGAQVGELKGDAFVKASANGKIFKAPNVELPLLQSTNLGFGVYVDKGPLNKKIQALLDKVRNMSPLVIDDAGLRPDGVLFAEGRIIASVALLEGVEIPFRVEGDEVTVSFPIPTDKLHAGPVEVTSAGVEVAVSPEGLALKGGLAFVVKGLGHGHLVAGVGPGEKKKPQAPAAGGGAHAAGPDAQGETSGISLFGTFDLESDKLQPASINIGYQNDQLTIDATVGLAPNSVKGVESAQIHIVSDNTGLLVSGTAKLSVPGLAGTELMVQRDQTGAITIGADNIPLPVGGIPGVRGATANIHVKQNPDTGEWSLWGGGSADIDIAGVNGTLAVDINGTFITITGQDIAIKRPPLEGHGNFLVTNKPRGPDGNPMDGEPTQMTASGHAEASLPLGKYLKGTVGGTFLPNGELQFTGGVSLPPSLDLFERKSFDRVLFKPPALDIPLIGVSVAGQRIGIFLTIGGSLSFSAGIGPGQLRNAALTADFNPDHPENTTVQGTAQFVIPADAGLRLEIHGGVAAGIPIVSAEAGIEAGGTLGIVGEASADVAVDWTPQKGLSIEAIGHLHAQPQFTFDLTAYVNVTADVVITEIELYNKRWTLASFSAGPEMSVGVDLPVRWSEQAGLDFDINKVVVQRPNIDIEQLGMDLVNKVVGS